MKNHPENWVFGFAIGDQLIKHSKRNYPSHWVDSHKETSHGQKGGAEKDAISANTQMRGMRKANDGARERRKLLGLLVRIVRQRLRR